MTFNDLTDAQIEAIKPFVDSMIVTVTKPETDALYERMAPVAGEKFLRFFRKESTFVLGMLGPYLIAHLECIRMGGIDLGGSSQTISNGIKEFEPKIVIMTGIAFGMKPEEQRIGDVLVSESIVNYDIKRIGTELIYRSNIPDSGLLIYNRFKSCVRDWSFSTGNIKPEVHCGRLLAGESLIDKKNYRDRLSRQFPSAIGGDMEGAGLFAAATQGKAEWLIVKGICDFADGNKAINKKENQRVAAAAAVDFCLHVFSTPKVFREMGLLEFDRSSGFLYDSRLAVQSFFDTSFKLHKVPHFELRSVHIKKTDLGELTVNGEVFSLMSEIATFYVIFKLLEKPNENRIIYNSDIEPEEIRAKLRIEDIYPSETKNFEWKITNITTTDNSALMVEIWSPQRLLSARPGDDRIALFARKIFSII